MDTIAHNSGNALIDETSPYLRQHAHNPVDWRPWNDAALLAARTADKPILLSIGYSACHWCHVMAHESFEDPAVAAVMNALYVCIKVDREERPDLDRVYQAAHNLMARRGGGWPLTMFLAPDDLTPFFGGTYFPKTARYGLPAFPDLLRQVADYYRTHRADLAAQAASLRQTLSAQDIHDHDRVGALTRAPITQAVTELKQQFDAVDGGFGDAPKFPHPTGVRRLLMTVADTAARAMATQTLAAMASRGLYDHLEGGFFRYSVDAHWHIPHFEKMLYDNAQLIGLYAEGYQATGEAAFADAARASADWVIRDMQAPAGGYYATLDADSDGTEGAFYVWTRAEVRALFDADTYALVAAHFGVDGPPNFEDHHYHLAIHQPATALAADRHVPLPTIVTALAGARQVLTAQRASRARPGRDEKILTAWNGLMIKGMARAGRLLGAPELIASARRALNFIQTTLWDGERLAAVTKDGRTSPYGYLDDTAFLIDGILELLMADWRLADLSFAQALADALIDDFGDSVHGGFYFTAEDHEPLLYRPKPFADDAIPAGNGVAAASLQKLGHLLALPHLADIADRTIRAGVPAVSRYPSMHGTLLEALEDLLEAPTIIVVRGEGATLRRWHALAQSQFAPRRLVFAIPNDETDLPPGLAARAPRGDIVAYACHGLQCDAPIEHETDYIQLLAETAAVRS
ncbi:MAG: thioredoxin domain-containing protein [Acidiferrobacter sp.]